MTKYLFVAYSIFMQMSSQVEKQTATRNEVIDLSDDGEVGQSANGDGQSTRKRRAVDGGRGQKAGAKDQGEGKDQGKGKGKVQGKGKGKEAEGDDQDIRKPSFGVDRAFSCASGW